MSPRSRAALLVFAAFAASCVAKDLAKAADQVAVNPAPAAQDWANLAKLPDWSGVWHPDIKYAGSQFAKDAPPWTAEAAQRIAELKAAEEAGHPHNVYIDCLPEGMPSFVLMTLNGLEFLFTPGRITILGEFDGNRTRRIYTDGRPHPSDPDLTFNGHSIGHWEGDTLVVDTVAILPETVLPLGQAVAIPNNGDLHIVEHIHLANPNTLLDEIEISAPHVLSAPWKSVRAFTRHRQRKFDIVEASCLQGNFIEGRDPKGNAVFIPVPHEEGGAPFASNK